jgi:catechol 2,3-dioxygenase-like lactoylglutathione lyase family enzyme
VQISHFGITVADVLAAERLYAQLFGMSVYVREALTPRGWRSLDPDLTPEAAEAFGLSIGMVVLRRGQFALSLQQETETRITLLEHAAIIVPAPEFEALKARVVQFGLTLLQDTPSRFVFADPNGMIWEITDADILLTAKDMGHGWVDREGRIHDGNAA